MITITLFDSIILRLLPIILILLIAAIVHLEYRSYKQEEQIEQLETQLITEQQKLGTMNEAFINLIGIIKDIIGPDTSDEALDAGTKPIA